MTDAVRPDAGFRYDAVAQALHWAVAALAVAVVGLGLVVPDMPRGSGGRALVLLLHRSLGIAILAAMAVRLLWRWRYRFPPLPAHLTVAERLLAAAAHWVLYLLFFGMPLSGYVNAAAAGHAVDLFGVVSIPPLVPQDPRVAQIAAAVHLAGQFLVYLFVAMHVAAALLHHFVRHDDVMMRMLPARRER